jgi:hypothetical protein
LERHLRVVVAGGGKPAQDGLADRGPRGQAVDERENFAGQRGAGDADRLEQVVERRRLVVLVVVHVCAQD